MRAVLTWIARYLPPRHMTDRLAPMSASLVALLAGFWTVFQYSDQLAIERVKTGFEMHSQYREVFGPRGAAAVLPRHLDKERMIRLTSEARCQLLVDEGLLAMPSAGCKDLDRAEFARLMEGLPELSERQRAALRDWNEALQAAAVWEPDEVQQLEALLAFYQAVAVCIDQNACDPQTTLALFRREIVPFLNAVCGKLQENSVAMSDARRIAQMIREVDGAAPPEWTTDKRRTQQFLCNWLTVGVG